jgi:DNA-binding transcriptional ArsR family regulator
MSLGGEKKRILELLWLQAQPMMMKEIAQKLGLKIAATNMHLLGLRKTGHIHTPKHGFYVITELGKAAIGLPKIDKALAGKILSHVSSDKAFHFYTGVHQYTHVMAHSLAEFIDKLGVIDIKSVEFHVPRKDFENWIYSLGDEELAKRLGLIRNMHLHGENLRARLHEAAKRRAEELKHLQS